MKIDIAAAAAPASNYLEAMNLASALSQAGKGFLKRTAERQKAQRQVQLSRLLGNIASDMGVNLGGYDLSSVSPTERRAIDERRNLMGALQDLGEQGLLDMSTFEDILGQETPTSKLDKAIQEAETRGKYYRLVKQDEREFEAEQEANIRRRRDAMMNDEAPLIKFLKGLF